jgi:hypothetical protein
VDFDVYNLEFRHRCFEMTIGGYRFTRVDDYEERLQGLQHLSSGFSEFSVPANTGSHQLTARLTPPDPEPPKVLPWSSNTATALDDLALLLSIFTGRQVFAIQSDETERVLIADSRLMQWGGVTRVSIPYEKSSPRIEDDPYSCGDDGLEIHLNHVYDLMRTSTWRKQYRDGHYLLLFRVAMQERTIEAAFIQCWAIWEHLFSILNDSWMSTRSIERARATDKIAFLLVTYAVHARFQIGETERLQSLAQIRNRLVHFGRFPEQDEVHSDATLFIRMTEWIVAKTLGLEPSEVFDTLKGFEAFVGRK